MTVARAIYLTGVLVICAWVLVPLWLIAANALGGQAVISAWPKPFIPPVFTFETLGAFLAIEGVFRAMLIGFEVALLCTAFSVLLGLPAGYALARYSFRGANAFRLMVLLTRAFPVGILALPLTVGFMYSRASANSVIPMAMDHCGAGDRVNRLPRLGCIFKEPRRDRLR